MNNKIPTKFLHNVILVIYFRPHVVYYSIWKFSVIFPGRKIHEFSQISWDSHKKIWKYRE